MTDDDMPRIWFSRIFSTMNVVSYGIRGILKNMEYATAYRDFVPYDTIKDQVEVKALAPRDKSARITKSDADAFMIAGGYIVISPKLGNILMRFELGQTRQMVEVSWQKWGGAPSDREPYYLFHVAEAKPTLISEKSNNIKQSFGYDRKETDEPVWRPIDLPDTLAVMASAAEGSGHLARSVVAKQGVLFGSAAHCH